MANGLVFDIQPFTVHDGPGIRTTVFFQGCSCSCSWCHNPESQRERGVLEYYPARCIGCGNCQKACQHQALQRDDQGNLQTRELCTYCGDCVSTCYSQALLLKGRSRSLSDVLEVLLADQIYYEESGGGVTLSGGEPVLQQSFAQALLQQCKAKRIHTALQTAGNYPFEQLHSLLPWTDLIMYDLKAYSPEIYEEYIGGDRSLMLGNLQQLVTKYHGDLIVRTPVIGGVNANPEEIAAIARFLQDISTLSYYQLIPYHSLGAVKYEALGLQLPDHFYTPSREVMQHLEQVAATYVTVNPS